MVSEGEHAFPRAVRVPPPRGRGSPARAGRGDSGGPAATRTLGLPERLQQELGLLLDPVLVALLPHPEVTQGAQGKPPDVLPGRAIIENYT